MLDKDTKERIDSQTILLRRNMASCSPRSTNYWILAFLLCLAIVSLLDCHTSSSSAGGSILQRGNEKTIAYYAVKEEQEPDERSRISNHSLPPFDAAAGGGDTFQELRASSRPGSGFKSAHAINQVVEDTLQPLRKTITDSKKDVYVSTTNEASSSLKIETAISTSVPRKYQGGQFFSAMRGRQEATLNATKAVGATSTFSHNGGTKHCEQWAILYTTISGPSEAVKGVASLKNWCLLIVADTTTPIDYMQQLQSDSQNTSVVHFLSIEDQKYWEKENTLAAQFVKAVPYSHFGRKNVGYLYAILHGAEFIFDFDDAVQLVKNKGGLVMEPIDDSLIGDTVIPSLVKDVFNYHDLMNASVPNSWPRGFPEDYADDIATHGSIAFSTTEDLDLSKVGVMVICINGEMLRIRDVKNRNNRTFEEAPVVFNSAHRLLVPSHAFTPYTAKSTVHLSKALWATFLPTRVPHEVSDIWRSYIAQTIFRQIGQQVAVLPPRLVQSRGAQNATGVAPADENEAEDDGTLAFKTSNLIKFLMSWSADEGQNVPELVEKLWIDLYEHSFIDKDDVALMQLWLRILMSSDYEFPSIRRSRLPRLVVMGQFNYAMDPSNVVWWVQKWRQVVNKVVVRGPWNQKQLSTMKEMGIACFYSQDDHGFVSPIKNLMLTLEEFEDDDTVDGVLYIHDDALVSMKHLIDANIFPSQDSIIVSKEGSSCFQDLRQPSAITSWNTKNAYYILPGGEYRDLKGANFSTWQDLRKHSLRDWSNWELCLPQTASVFSDSRSLPFKDEIDGSMLIPTIAQSDFLYIPKKFGKTFIETAQVFVDSGVFLECAVPTIVDILQHFHNASISTANLCTEWIGLKRGTLAMVNGCLNNRVAAYRLFHPFKLEVHGLKKWGEVFDAVTQ